MIDESGGDGRSPMKGVQVMIHPLAGKKVQQEDLINLDELVEAYYSKIPEADDKRQRVAFGTSGHRGRAQDTSFNDLHVAAIAQAVCDLRNEFGATALCFVGADTHLLSSPALATVLEVLAGNGVVAGVDEDAGYVPTPSVSRAIIRYNENHDKKADGLIITPSHNPPDNGGIKYNPLNGGPADTSITKRIEEKANAYIGAGGKGIKRIAVDEIPPELQVEYPFKRLYVEELPQIIDMTAIQKARPHVLINALGGSGGAYWEAIRDMYQLDLTIINSEADPTFSFMAYDHDGVVRMDCSSAYAMAEVIAGIGAYDLAVGNDPDYDRYGIVTAEGLLPANHFLVTAGAYLFGTRSWQGKGFGKTVVVTGLVDRFCNDKHIPVYEVPVGFKYFAPLLFDGTIGIGGEESAGASFLKKDGTVWTTDKDGMIMGLLAMEMLATTGQSPARLYEALTKDYGTPVFTRVDTACDAETKDVLSHLSGNDVVADTLAGETLEEVRTTAYHEALDIGGLKLTTVNSWLVARPSGTENLYKIYAETFAGKATLDALIKEGQRIVDDVARS